MITTDSPAPQAQKKIAIIGDFIIDETWYTNTTKISPEAPVPVATLTSDKPHQTPGGAGLAAKYAAKNNLPICLLSAISKEAEKLLEENRIIYGNLSPLSQNVKKIRYIDQSSKYHLLRVDNDELIEFPNFREVRDWTEKYITSNKLSCLALLDYRKGVLKDKDTCQQIISLAKQGDIPVFVDTRGDTTKFVGSNVAKLNLKEFNKALETTTVMNGYELREVLQTDVLLVTKADKGAEAYTRDNHYDISIPIIPGTPDVTGAGDVFDINFCYYYYMQKFDILTSLKHAVEKATKFVRQPIEIRL